MVNIQCNVQFSSLAVLNWDFNQVTWMNPWKIAFKNVGPNQLQIIVIIPWYCLSYLSSVCWKAAWLSGTFLAWTLSRIRGTALKKTFGRQFLSTNWTKNLIWFSADLQYTLGSVGFTAIFTQNFLSLSVFVGTWNSLQLLTKNACSSRVLSRSC